MATVHVNFDGMERLRASVRAEVGRTVYAAADLVASDAALSIVRGSVSGAGHVPSRPGEPPNADTRQLDTSIIVQPDLANLRATVVAQAPYAVHLEYGTQKMAARPYLRPALIRNQDEMQAMIAAAVARATRQLSIFGRARAALSRLFRR